MESRSTDKDHLRTYAYGSAQRLADRAAIYAHLRVTSVDLGPHPWRGDGIVGFASTWLDPSLTGRGLDIGCGRGQYLPLLAAQCTSVVAADLSAGMLAEVPAGAWVRMMADVEALPFSDGAFDVVLANHLLYHAPNLGAAVDELRRVVRPGGALLATTNGDGNFGVLYDLLEDAASRARGEPAERLVPADSAFTLETGAVALGRAFESVAVGRTAGALHIDASSLDALRAYYRSTDDEWTSRYGIDWPVLEAALDSVLQSRLARDHEMVIPTSSGVLVAS